MQRVFDVGRSGRIPSFLDPSFSWGRLILDHRLFSYGSATFDLHLPSKWRYSVKHVHQPSSVLSQAGLSVEQAVSRAVEEGFA